MVTPDAKRDAVAHACLVHGVSQRRACEALEVDRSSVRYRTVRAPDVELREAMKAVASQRRRFGYRRIHVMLQRQGIEMNIKKLRRLYGEEKLQVRKRGGRKRALGTRRPMLVPDRARSLQGTRARSRTSRAAADEGIGDGMDSSRFCGMICR